MAMYTICFMATGGITVEAESEEEAMNRFEADDIQADIGTILAENGVDITGVYEDPDTE